jgi:hypothetical protein
MDLKEIEFQLAVAEQKDEEESKLMLGVESR